MRNKIIDLIFIFLALQMGLPMAHAAYVSVIVAQGEVTGGPSGHETKVKIGSKINNGDSLKTAPDSLAIISFQDGTRLKLKENSQIVIHAEDSAQKKPSGIDLVIGAVFASVKKSAKNPPSNPPTKDEAYHFNIKTKTAVAGVRGTDFFTSVGEKDAFWLCVEDGVVDVTPDGSKQKIAVPKGLGILIEKGKAPDAPKSYAWTKKLNWNMDPLQGEIIDHTSIEGEYNDLLHHHYD